MSKIDVLKKVMEYRGAQCLVPDDMEHGPDVEAAFRGALDRRAARREKIKQGICPTCDGPVVDTFYTPCPKPYAAAVGDEWLEVRYDHCGHTLGLRPRFHPRTDASKIRELQ